MLPLISHQKTSLISHKTAKKMSIYHHPSPQESPFYKCIADYFEDFVQVYDECFEREYGLRRPVICEVIQEYLGCGNITHGFVRIRFEHFG